MTPTSSALAETTRVVARSASCGAPHSERSLTRLILGLGRALDLVIGFLTMIPVLAVLSAAPVLNLLSLGYLLEASGRVARSGRLRMGFVGLLEFAAFGKAVLAVGICLLPLQLVHSLWRDAEWIAPGNPHAGILKILLLFGSLLAGTHVLWALLRGGALRHFLWPAPLLLGRWLMGGAASELPGLQRLQTFLKGRQIKDFLMLGALGFAGAGLWLALPVTLLIFSANLTHPGLSLLGSAFGGSLLGVAALVLPFLQTRFALTRNFREFLSLRQFHHSFRRAPLAFWAALSATLLLALPLYLLKIELAPDEIAWLPNLLFISLAIPARLLLGWAVARSERRENPGSSAWCWIAGLGAIPVVATYVVVVWLSQYLSWHGSLSSLEQHAFLVPAPLWGR